MTEATWANTEYMLSLITAGWPGQENSKKRRNIIAVNNVSPFQIKRLHLKQRYTETRKRKQMSI